MAAPVTLPNMRLYVLGPAEGAVAFEISRGLRSTDDSLFIPSTAILLRSQAVVVRLVRIYTPDGWRSRYCVYQQIFEPGMVRPGHVLGVICEVAEVTPSATVVFDTLWKLMEFLKARCVEAGHFCDLVTFKRFVREEIAEDVPAILEDLRRGNIRSTIPPASTSAQRRFSLEVENLSPASVGEMSNWIFASPLGLCVNELLISTPGAGELGAHVLKVGSLIDVFHLAAVYSHQERLRLEGLRRSLIEEVDKCKAHLKNSHERLRLLEEECAQLKVQVQGSSFVAPHPVNRPTEVWPQRSPYVPMYGTSAKSPLGGQWVGSQASASRQTSLVRLRRVINSGLFVGVFFVLVSIVVVLLVIRPGG